MIPLSSFLEKLEFLGVRLRLEGDQLRYEAPKGAVTPELMQELKRLKPELLLHLQNGSVQSAFSPAAESGLRRLEHTGAVPLSFAQQRLWFLYQLEGASPAYNILAAEELSGALDLGALKAALAELVRRHEMLRTLFRSSGRDGEAEQVICGESTVELIVEDLRSAGPEEAQREVQRIASREARWNFRLETGPLLRLTLIRLKEDLQQLRLTMHHIIGDGWSLGIVMRELSALYESIRLNQASVLPRQEIRYSDFAVWQRTQLSGEALEKQARFWKQRLEGAPQRLELPVDGIRPVVQSYEGAALPVCIPPDLTSQLSEFSTRAGASLYMTMVSAFALLLSRYASQTDLLFGTQAANRNRKELESVVGFFINTLVLRAKILPGDSFCSLVARMKNEVLDSFEHQDFPFEKLVELLQPERVLGRNPLAQVMFLWQNLRLGASKLAGLGLRSMGIERVTAKFDLTFELGLSNGGIAGVIEYNTSLFEKATVQQMASSFVQLLEQVVANPESMLMDLSLTSLADLDRLKAWNRSVVQAISDSSDTLHGRFARMAFKFPDKAAVVTGSSTLTYRELDGLSQRIAGRLQQMGARPDALVAVCMDRSVELIAALLGILRSGAAYVPLDPAHPVQRKQTVLRNCRPICLIRDRSAPCQFESVGVPTLEIPDFVGEFSFSENCSTGGNLAYVIHTSGSTGTPKGVLIEHRSALNLVDGLLQHVWKPARGHGRVALVAPVAFDASVQQIFAALSNGSTLVLVDEATRRDGAALSAFLSRHAIELSDATPSLLSLLAETGLPSCLKQILVGGEALPSDLVQKFIGTGTILTNVYGPTECTVDATFWNLEFDRSSRWGSAVPIGRPLPGCEIRVLDSNGLITPPGVPGELWVGGSGVGRGYLDDPAQTADRFRPDPWNPGGRIYRTGDLGRWRTDGLLEFHGRNDDQVKVRGFRIELGEIEHQLRSLSEVKDAGVLVAEQGLVAWLVTAHNPTVESLRESLRERLPEYMIPAQFRTIDALPRTSNGKLDRRKLAAIPSRLLQQGTLAVEPRDEREQAVAGVWRGVLGLSSLSIRDNFFSLGGDSIKALQVAARLREVGFKMEIRDLFLHPTIEGLAPRLDRHLTATAHTDAWSGKVPLLPIQRRFFETYTGNLNHYNQAVLIDSPRRLDVARLRTALARIVEHHDVLRSSFRKESGEWMTEIRPADGRLQLEVCRLPDGSEGDLLRRSRCVEAQRGFAIERGGLFAAILFSDSGRDQLFLVAHHLVIDGVSWRVLLEDLSTLLQPSDEGSQRLLPSRSSSIRDWAEAMLAMVGTSFISSLDHWKSVLAQTPPAWPEVGSDHSGESGICVSRSMLAAPTTEFLLGRAHETFRTEVNDLLLTGLARALQKWTRSKRLFVILEGHGRETFETGIDLSRTVGWFTSLFPVVLDPGDIDDPGRQIKNVKEGLRTVPHKGISYGWLVNSGHLPGQLSMDDRVVFNYLGQFDTTESSTGWKRGSGDIGSCSDPGAIFPYDLEIVAMVVGGCLQFEWTARSSKIDQAILNQLADALVSELLTIVTHIQGKKEAELTPSDIDYGGFDVDKLDQFLEQFDRP